MWKCDIERVCISVEHTRRRCSFPFFFFLVWFERQEGEHKGMEEWYGSRGIWVTKGSAWAVYGQVF
jgi:hypothetical protein